MNDKVKMLREYPNLPVLSLQQCTLVFNAAKFGPSLVASWTGHSRVAVSRWMNGHADNAKNTTLESVSTLAYKVLRALKHKHYPLQKQRNVTEENLDALRDAAYEKPLSQCSAQELLPKAWLEKFNMLPKDQDAIA